MKNFDSSHWAVILGGSSGFGLATAKKLARHGMNILVVHRDRRGAMKRIEAEFDKIRALDVGFKALNTDALSKTGRQEVVEALQQEMGATGKVRMLLHSIAFGNLKPIAPPSGENFAEQAVERLAEKLKIDKPALEQVIADLVDDGVNSLHTLQTAVYGTTLMDEEDMERTIYSMGSSILSWVQDLHNNGLFAPDARILGMTSEGNEVAWKGYAAVAAAKVALESISRSIAVEYAAFGIRSNIIQAGVTPTPALKLIPGNTQMKAVAQLRNPFKETTTPEKVADFIALMCTDEAAWVNGSILRVDGGEHIASL
ncbi:MAG: SDR family oxidoreductase [Pseudomonadales bacterium]|nr:SDR family oxidoreductase [Pseudomonadales bacterium]